MPSLQQLVRPNIWALQPYSSARDEYKGVKAHVFLDANESPYNSPLNRYPDPLQAEVKARISQLKGIDADSIFLGNGSDEAIDLVFRVFCQPAEDNVVAIAPTYGMYQVCADINDVEYRSVPLRADYSLDAEAVLRACDEHTKAVFLCSPNNPTGNSLEHDEMEKILRNFGGITVIDEAYIDFSSQPSFRNRLQEFPRMIVLSTMSKAWGCAAIRLGMAFAAPEIIALYNKVKYPYNINVLTQQAALKQLADPAETQRCIDAILSERKRMQAELAKLPLCNALMPTDANFILMRTNGDATEIYNSLVTRGIIVRNRSKVFLCKDCLRITIGTPEENDELLEALKTLF